jgi:hypothetical protein
MVQTERPWAAATAAAPVQIKRGEDLRSIIDGNGAGLCGPFSLQSALGDGG